MAIWANPCRRCGDDEQIYYVACSDVADLPTDARIVQVKVGDGWHCAVLDRSSRVAVERVVLRQAVATDAADCTQCRDA